LFKPGIENGLQKEKPDHWQSYSSPWLIERPTETCSIPLFGRIEHEHDRVGDYNPMWVDWQFLVGVPYDIPIVGYGGHTMNYLRSLLHDEFRSNDKCLPNPCSACCNPCQAPAQRQCGAAAPGGYES
jgi:glucan phosphorylase